MKKMPPVMSIDIDNLREALESLPSGGVTGPVSNWTKEMDDLLLEFWPKKRHTLVADILGVSSTTALKRYRQLTQGNK